MTFHALEIARYQLMISVCEKYQRKLKDGTKKEKEQIIIDNLKKQLAQWQQNAKSVKEQDRLTNQSPKTQFITE